MQNFLELGIYYGLRPLSKFFAVLQATTYFIRPDLSPTVVSNHRSQAHPLRHYHFFPPACLPCSLDTWPQPAPMKPVPRQNLLLDQHLPGELMAVSFGSLFHLRFPPTHLFIFPSLTSVSIIFIHSPFSQLLTSLTVWPLLQFPLVVQSQHFIFKT